jgi:hypothetical protein
MQGVPAVPGGVLACRPPDNISQLFLTAKQILVPTSRTHYFIIFMIEDDKDTHEAQRGPRL